MNDQLESDKRQEQRLSARKPLRTRSTLVLGADESLPFEAIDIASGGMGMSLSRKLNAEQQCRLSFALFGNGEMRDVSVVAKVTHCVPCKGNVFKAGLQFVEMVNEAIKTTAGQFMLDYPTLYTSEGKFWLRLNTLE